AAAATAAAARAAAPSASAAATAAGPGLTRPGLVDCQAPAVELLIVQGVDGGLRLGIRAHLDETESLASTRVPVGNDLRALDTAVLREQLLQVGAVHAIREVPDVQFLAHRQTPQSGQHEPNQLHRGLGGWGRSRGPTDGKAEEAGEESPEEPTTRTHSGSNRAKYRDQSTSKIGKIEKNHTQQRPTGRA